MIQSSFSKLSISGGNKKPSSSLFLEAGEIALVGKMHGLTSFQIGKEAFPYTFTMLAHSIVHIPLDDLLRV